MQHRYSRQEVEHAKAVLAAEQEAIKSDENRQRTKTSIDYLIERIQTTNPEIETKEVRIVSSDYEYGTREVVIQRHSREAALLVEYLRQIQAMQ